MPQFRLSEVAQQDIESILTWTHQEFGEQGRLRYESLLIQAIRDVASDPERPGCVRRPELVPSAFTYSIRHSRQRVSRSAGRVRNARHFLLCRPTADGFLEVSRVLHDSMELRRHLPSGYQLPDDR